MELILRGNFKYINLNNVLSSFFQFLGNIRYDFQFQIPSRTLISNRIINCVPVYSSTASLAEFIHFNKFDFRHFVKPFFQPRYWKLIFHNFSEFHYLELGFLDDFFIKMSIKCLFRFAVYRSAHHENYTGIFFVNYELVLRKLSRHKYNLKINFNANTMLIIEIVRASCSLKHKLN